MRGAGSLHCDRLEQLRIDGAARIDFGNVLIRRIAAPRARILLKLSRDEHEAVDRRLDSPNRRLGNAVAAFPATEEIRVRIALRRTNRSDGTFNPSLWAPANTPIAFAS